MRLYISPSGGNGFRIEEKENHRGEMMILVEIMEREPGKIVLGWIFEFYGGAAPEVATDLL
jgi:hypothetical protein